MKVRSRSHDAPRPENLPPKAARIDDTLTRSVRLSSVSKRRMIHKQHANICRFKRFIRCNQLCIAKPGRQCFDMRLHQQETHPTLLRKLARNIQCRAFAEIIDVGFEGQPETRNRRQTVGIIFFQSAIAASILSNTQRGFESFTSRACRTSLACAGAEETMNHGSTAMQCPPTPGPG